MIKQKKLTVILSIALAVLVIAGVSAYAASNYGTQSDPLITRSYLNDAFTPEILGSIQNEIEASIFELEKAITKLINENGSDTFRPLTLSAGQRLSGAAGVELMLRSGTAECAGQSGLLDITLGKTLPNGAALTANHMYMLHSDGDSVFASSEAQFLVRGSYTIS